MSDIAVGLIAVVSGLILCFGGRTIFRIILSVWGGFVGFTLGSSVFSSFTGEAPFSTALGWIVSVLAALVFAGLAYGFYVLAVIIAIGSIGYWIGAGLGLALGASGTVLLVLGVLAALLLAGAALATNLPDVLLTVVTSLTGAAAFVGGVMLIVGLAEPADLTETSLREFVVEQPIWWTGLYVVIAVVGMVVQHRAGRGGTMRSFWPRR
ncbi:MAG: DUF4203 domain-containing protein [Arachnia sp.]